MEKNYFPGIDPDELEMGANDEREEHGMPQDKAELTARQHLDKPNQGHYYSGMEKAKDKGMLKEKPMSPTAMSPQILGIAVRGSVTGGLPSGGMPSMGPTSLTPSDTAIAPEGAGVDPKSKAALGGLELVSKQTPNSTVVDGTPQNQMISSAGPIADIVPPTPADEHPSQVQQVDGEPVQALTGTSADREAPMGEKPEPEKFEVDREDEEEYGAIDIDVPKGEGEEQEGEEEDDMKLSNVLKEGKHKAGCQCGFCKNKGSFGKKKDKAKDKDEGEEKDEKADSKKEKSKKKPFGTGLDEVFARHKKLMEDKLGLKEDFTDDELWKDLHPELPVDPYAANDARERGLAGCTPMGSPAHAHKTVEPILPDPYTGEKDKYAESYSPAFEKMRGLAGISKDRVLSSNGLWENKTNECVPCGCDKPNTEHPKKTKKLTTEQLRKLQERFGKKGQLTEQEQAVSTMITSALKARGEK